MLVVIGAREGLGNIIAGVNHLLIFLKTLGQ